MGDGVNGETLYEIPAELQQTALRNVQVRNWLRQGGSLPGLINYLVEALERVQAQAMELELLCPRRYRLEDGREMIWRCPEELVPLRDLSFIKTKTQYEETGE